MARNPEGFFGHLKPREEDIRNLGSLALLGVVLFAAGSVLLES